MKTVLLAYEREQDLASVETLLQSRGHRVVKARTGIDALEIARRDGAHIVVSDVLLPKLDGFALCRRIKEDPVLRHLPVLLHSFRVEGPKYEAFAAEVGAERFMPRGTTLEDLAAALEEIGHGSGTMRMPALVPELLEKREHDRRRLADIERQLRELEVANQQLTASERVARERAEQEARARIEQAAAEASRVRELQNRIRELEAAQQHLVQAESRARGAAEENRAELAKLAVLESRINEMQAARARIQAAAVDAERAFAALPLPTWLCDMESRLLHAVSDSAAALFGIVPEQVRGRALADLLPGIELGDDPARPIHVPFVRPDGSKAMLEIRRQSVSYAGRACWLMTARDVAAEQGTRERMESLELRAKALEHSPQASCIVDANGRLEYANPAFVDMLRLDPARLSETTLQQFEMGSVGDSTIRSVAIAGSGLVTQETRWRRRDGVVLDVELESATSDDLPGRRVLTARDVSNRRRAAVRSDLEQHRVLGLLDLTQRAHSLTEAETLNHSLDLVQQLTHSEAAYVFLTLPEATQLELVARRDREVTGETLSVLSRWRGAPPAETALHETLSSQRPVARESPEGTGTLRQAGLPGTLRRQLAVPILEGGRLVGVLLAADKPEAYDDEDRRHVAHVADVLWKLLRRRRSDAEIVSAMDHMERVMLGTIEALAGLSELQDACKTGRARRVADLAAGIGLALGLPGHAIRGLRVMGQLIDVGMLQIPRELLWRPGSLTPSEFELVRTHPERGYETLRRIEFPWPVAETVRQHHERLDGTGYPRGLKGDEILLEARIIAVADTVEAMMAHRPHRPALSLGACIEELQSQAGRRYDARVVKACVKLLRERETPLQGTVTTTILTEGESPAGQRIA